MAKPPPVPAPTNRELRKLDGTDALQPGAALLAKLGSILVHTSEGVSDGGHAFDWFAVQALIMDSEVQAWLDGMQRLALLPVKRS